MELWEPFVAYDDNTGTSLHSLPDAEAGLAYLTHYHNENVCNFRILEDYMAHCSLQGDT